MSDKDTSGGIHYHYHFYGPCAHRRTGARTGTQTPQRPAPGEGLTHAHRA